MRFRRLTRIRRQPVCRRQQGLLLRGPGRNLAEVRWILPPKYPRAFLKGSVQAQCKKSCTYWLLHAVLIGCKSHKTPSFPLLGSFVLGGWHRSVKARVSSLPVIMFWGSPPRDFWVQLHIVWTLRVRVRHLLNTKVSMNNLHLFILHNQAQNCAQFESRRLKTLNGSRGAYAITLPSYSCIKLSIVSCMHRYDFGILYLVLHIVRSFQRMDVHVGHTPVEIFNDLLRFTQDSSCSGLSTWFWLCQRCVF